MTKTFQDPFEDDEEKLVQELFLFVKWRKNCREALRALGLFLKYGPEQWKQQLPKDLKAPYDLLHLGQLLQLYPKLMVQCHTVSVNGWLGKRFGGVASLKDFFILYPVQSSVLLEKHRTLQENGIETRRLQSS